jgi:hypothetical protein
MPRETRKIKNAKKTKEPNDISWDMVCEPAILERLKTEDKFWQVIALSRSVNTLSFSHWAVLPFWDDRSWHGQQARTNLFFFTCGALYEALGLVGRMNKNFHTEDSFAGLKAILKDKTARKLNNMHLERARNHMVFHFFSNSFGEIVNIPGESECSFVAGLGSDPIQRYYTFADILAMEYFVGYAANNSEKFYENLEQLMIGTRKLTADFVNAAEILISQSLLKWGFKRRNQTIMKEIATKKRLITKKARMVGLS